MFYSTNKCYNDKMVSSNSKIICRLSNNYTINIPLNKIKALCWFSSECYNLSVRIATISCKCASIVRISHYKNTLST